MGLGPQAPCTSSAPGASLAVVFERCPVQGAADSSADLHEFWLHGALRRPGMPCWPCCCQTQNPMGAGAVQPGAAGALRPARRVGPRRGLHGQRRVLQHAVWQRQVRRCSSPVLCGASSGCAGGRACAALHWGRACAALHGGSTGQPAAQACPKLAAVTGRCSLPCCQHAAAAQACLAVAVSGGCRPDARAVGVRYTLGAGLAALGSACSVRLSGQGAGADLATLLQCTRRWGPSHAILSRGSGAA